MEELKRVAITGIGGYVGTKLMHILEERNYCEKIIGIDVREPKQLLSKTKFYKMDIRDEKLQDIFKEEGITAVVHLAFILNPIHNQFLMRDINYNGTANVLKALRACRAKRFLYFSSTTAYGAWKDNQVPLKEDAPLRGNPDFEYANDKICVEAMMDAFKKENPDVKITIFRPCVIIGPNVDNYIAAGFLQKVFPLMFNANPPWQFVHEDDVVNATVAALEKGKAGIFNLAGDGTLTLEECVKMAGGIVVRLPKFIVYIMASILWDLRIPLIRSSAGVLEYLEHSWITDNSRLKNDLGYQPKYTSSEAYLSFLKAKNKI
ncbi:MAG TPA: SDR family oxidoreductase [bacterium]